MDRDKYQKSLATDENSEGLREKIIERRKRLEELREQRKNERKEKLDARRQYRIDKIKALTAKFYAVAAKRKWLVFLLGLGIVGYFLIAYDVGGVLTKLKLFFYLGSFQCRRNYLMARWVSFYVSTRLFVVWRQRAEF